MGLAESPHLAEHIFVRPRGIGPKSIFQDNFARSKLSPYPLIVLLLYILSSANFDPQKEGARGGSTSGLVNWSE